MARVVIEGFILFIFLPFFIVRFLNEIISMHYSY